MNGLRKTNGIELAHKIDVTKAKYVTSLLRQFPVSSLDVLLMVPSVSPPLPLIIIDSLM